MEEHHLLATIEVTNQLSNTLADAASAIALEAVTAQAITRRQAAEALRVHPHTISRWITARETQQPE